MSDPVTRDIAAEPAAVWAVLTDLDAADGVLTQVEHVERLTDGPFRLGTRWRETRGGRTHEREVVTFEALGRVAIRTTGDDGSYTTTYTLTATHPGTTLAVVSETGDVAEESTLKRLAHKVKDVFAHDADPGAQRDLDDIAAAAARG